MPTGKVNPRAKIGVKNLVAISASMGGSAYVFVAGNGSATANGAALLTAYAAASSMNPNGAALSATNRVTVIVAAGTYTTGGFNVVNQYVDVVSLTGDSNVYLDSINVTANNVYLKGLNLGSAAFTIATSLSLLVCTNCVGNGNSSFSASVTSGTFNNCTSTGTNVFGGGSSITASGTFNNCTGGTGSFGGSNSGAGTASGVFTNCTSSGGSTFGGNNIASGTFINCIAASTNNFGSGGTASGAFTNCTSSGFAVGGTTSASVAGSANVTLTANQTRNNTIVLTGAITAAISVIFPATPTSQQWTVINNTTGSFALTVKTSAGTGAVIGQGAKAIIYGDGTNINLVSQTLTSAYTVSTLPVAAVSVAGTRAYVTDALAPTFLGTLTGGSSTVCPVFYNGTAWVAG